MLSRGALIVLTLALLRLPEEASAAGRCAPATTEELREKLGPAYNARYMSIEMPPPDPQPPPRIYVRHTEGFQDDDDEGSGSGEADTSYEPWDEGPLSFRVSPDFRQDVGGAENDGNAHSGWHAGSADYEALSRIPMEHWLRERAAGNDRGGVTRRPRVRRDESTKKPWGCESHMEWEDLGEDRFPRYLRTVRCLGEECWFTHFRCKGRAFTVNVLRRATSEAPCAGDASPESLPADLREEWVFEERAVTFCCDCSKDD